MATITEAVCFFVLCLWGTGYCQTQPVASVKAVPASVQSISEVVTGYGTIEPYPEDDVKISAISHMRIDSIPVKPGDPVRPGQLVVVLQRDPSIDVQVDRAKISMEQAKLNLDRAHTLYESGVIPKVKLEEAQTNFELSKADYEIQQRSLAYAVKNSQIRSPIQGFVSMVNGVVGQIADPSDVILRIVNVEKIIARIGVETEDIGKSREGQVAEVRIPNLPGDSTFQGFVSKLNKEIDPATQLVHIWIRLENPSGVLQPGMFAEGRIFVKTEPNALTVPRSSVLSDDGGPFVYVVQNDTAHKVYVKTGIQTDEMIQIVEGIQNEQNVVFLGNYELEDGMKVKTEQ